MVRDQRSGYRCNSLSIPGFSITFRTEVFRSKIIDAFSLNCFAFFFHLVGMSAKNNAIIGPTKT